MTQERWYIAVDLGAESGRVMRGTVTPEKLELTECHRFANGPVEGKDGSLRWDFDSLFGQIRQGIRKAVAECPGKISGIAVGSWGVDFGLIGADGKLLENPYHYRDSRTNGMMEEAFQTISREDIYMNTGLQFMQLNTIFQLFSQCRRHPEVVKKAKRLIFTADLVAYHLCGRAYGEYTLASTSQLMDMKNGRWSKEIFDKLKLPMEIMPDVVKPGTLAGNLKPELVKEFGCDAIPVIAVGSHDTASAVAAVPAQGENWGYLSSGTWSLMGVEIPRAIITDKTLEYNFTNEGGVANTIRLLKNIMGLWLVQECRRQWQREGTDYSYGQIAEMAAGAKPFTAWIDPDWPEFLSPGDMPARINTFLKQKGQSPLTDKGRMIRAILESLAWKYRDVKDKIEEITGKKMDVLHIVGGGIQNELLCQFTADATGIPVLAGPVEATASGNILMQAVAAGQIGSVAEGRELVRKSFPVKQYKPGNTAEWIKQFEMRTKNLSKETAH